MLIAIILAATVWQEPGSCSKWMADNSAAVSACEYAREQHRRDVERRLRTLEQESTEE